MFERRADGTGAALSPGRSMPNVQSLEKENNPALGMALNRLTNANGARLRRRRFTAGGEGEKLIASHLSERRGHGN